MPIKPDFTRAMTSRSAVLAMREDLRIVSAACRRGDLIFSLPPPNRHHHILRKMSEFMPGHIVQPDDQGFLINTGEFVRRGAAMTIALMAEQVINPKPLRELYSEDLW